MSQVWTFAIGRITASLSVYQEQGYRYDGDDPEGEVQDKLDSGEYVAFESCVRIECDGETIAEDWLGGSVYEFGKESEFWTMHRDRNPMNRNCSLNPYNIGHYFPDMIREAIADARKTLASKEVTASG